MSKITKSARLVFQGIGDFFVRILPINSVPDYRYAFLVHPRNIKDVYRKYPFLAVLPENITLRFLRHYWPVTVSKITGLNSRITGKEIPGFIITIPLTARQMMEDRRLALKRIIQATKLAEKKGAKIIGLGGLTSSLSKGGLDLLDKTNICVTTGHAYTAVNVTNNLFELSAILKADKTKTQIAIVGAAGSVGSTSAKIIARAGYVNLLLIDVERKKDQFPNLINELKELNSLCSVKTSHQIRDISSADFIITATNSPEALVKSEDVKPGAVIIDDAQPSDVSPEVLHRDDALVIEAGVVHTPNINSHFNFNLKDKFDNFCCLAEVMLLASNEHAEHYVINRATLKHVDEISVLGKLLGFRIGEFQNFNERIHRDKIERVATIAQSK